MKEWGGLNTVFKTEVMSRFPIVANMISGMPERIWAECRMASLGRGEMLFKRGDVLSHVYILCSGSAVISSHDISGKEMRVVFVKEGNTIGEMEALASVKTMVYNARTYTPCEVLILSRKLFLEWIHADPSICLVMVEVLAKKLHDASNEVSEYTQYDAIVRVATLLSSETAGRLVMTRQEIAETCGISVRTVNRCLQRLKEEKLIEIMRGKIMMTEKHKEQLKRSPYNFENFEH